MSICPTLIWSPLQFLSLSQLLIPDNGDEIPSNLSWLNKRSWAGKWHSVSQRIKLNYGAQVFMLLMSAGNSLRLLHYLSGRGLNRPLRNARTMKTAKINGSIRSKGYGGITSPAVFNPKREFR